MARWFCSLQKARPVSAYLTGSQALDGGSDDDERHACLQCDARPRSGSRIFAAQNGDFFGNFIKYSDDFGETWEKPEKGIEFPEESGLKLTNIWLIEPGRADQPGTLYCGVDPASLWVSTDNGVTWSLNEGLENHPTRAFVEESRQRWPLPAQHRPRLFQP